VSEPSAFLARLDELSTHRGTAVSEGTGTIGETRSFEILLAEARALAHGLLAQLGARPSLSGDRVAILVSPGLDWVRAVFGVLYAGGVAVPLSPLHPVNELAYFADDADVSAVLLANDLADRKAAFADRLVLDPAGLRADARPLPSRGRHDAALMLYTSGTTGRPKGAVLTDENLATQARLVGSAWEVSSADRLLHTLPLHHMHGVAIAFFTAFFAGAETRFFPRFDAAQVWAALGDITIFMGVPTMYHRLFEHFDQTDDEARARHTAHARALRLATSGSAALPVSLAERWSAITGRIPLERFGMTEIGVGASNPLHGERVAGTVGRPLDSVVLRIVDESFVDVAPGSSGEIIIGGPSVFAGYFRRPEATAAAFRDGFFLTGDTACFEPDGAVRILGRTSVDILKSGGYKLSALEIEETLREHSTVVDVAVVGVPDVRWGDRVVAVVHTRDPEIEGAAAVDGLRAFCKERLAPYKVPRDFVLVASLPRNALGKVQKTQLRDELVANERSASSTT
jgi:malonyl-CoA/methylmalonyl-CoA synthetase